MTATIPDKCCGNCRFWLASARTDLKADRSHNWGWCDRPRIFGSKYYPAVEGERKLNDVGLETRRTSSCTKIEPFDPADIPQ